MSIAKKKYRINSVIRKYGIPTPNRRAGLSPLKKGGTMRISSVSAPFNKWGKACSPYWRGDSF
ncbi:hypothetical protein ACFL23_01245 [Patescibacteria group bacterium]